MIFRIVLRTLLFLFQTTTIHEENQLVNCTDGPAKITKSPFGDFFILLKYPLGLRQRVAHGENADEQLANLQKRICLIEFLRLGLVIGCQGSEVRLPQLAFSFIL